MEENFVSRLRGAERLEYLRLLLTVTTGGGKVPPRAEGRRGVGSGEGGSLALPPLSILTKDLDTYRFLSGLLA